MTDRAESEVGVDFRGFGFCEIGCLLIDRRLVGVLFDSKQEITFLDLLTFGEIALLDETRNAGNDVDFIDGNDSADKIT